MKKILLFCVILLSSCSTIPVPVVPKFPEAPIALMQDCPSLDTINKPTVLLSELVSTVTRNYQKYHECADIVDGWHMWYGKQKKIFEDPVSKK